MKNEDHYTYLFDESVEEKEIHTKLEAERARFESTDEYKEHDATVSSLLTDLANATRRRLSDGRRKRRVRNESRTEFTLDEFLKMTAEKSKAREAAMPDDQKSIIEAFRNVPDAEKGELLRSLRRITPDESYPVRKDGTKTTDHDLACLHAALAQTCIDFIQDTGLDEIDSVSFSIDNLAASVRSGDWDPQSDTMLHVYGTDVKDNGCTEAYIIGERMC